MYTSPLMILTGAGASIPLDIPGMADMAKRFRADIAKEKQPRRGMEYLREFGSGDDIEELLQLANAIIDFPHSNLSSFVDTTVRSQKSDGHGVGEYKRRRNKVIRDVREFRARLLEWLTQTCLRFDRDGSIELYGELIQGVARRGIPVFTTNYDGIPEYVAGQLKASIVDNFMEEGGRYFWDPTLRSFHGEGLRLIKIHGSIYWHADRNGRIEKIDPPTQYNSEGKPVEQLVIVPTRFKDIYQRNYFPLYTAFLRSLGSAGLLVVVGHSLRDEYLLAAVRDRLRDAGFKLVILDPAFPAKRALLSGVRDREDQIAHVPEQIQNVTGLLARMIEAGDADEAFDLACSAAGMVTERVSPTIELTSPGPWLEGGRSHGFQVRIRTTRRAGVVSGMVSVGTDAHDDIDLTSNLERLWGSPPIVQPFQDVSRSLRVYLGSSLSTGPHQLTLKLRDGDGRILAQAERSFRLKGL